ncbi:hypothetical protein CGZ75_12410 [Paenibacillus herberti]|uniref:Transcobalamin-like C-terminal domain-containing protein n=2 Tax=Paenibacillus herberti TaxID=1619309 RepID=A0A229P5S0_9BACL|nr:hypothetical protein CGZ75_12410 [Paenibacillus herberti]
MQEGASATSAEEPSSSSSANETGQNPASSNQPSVGPSTVPPSATSSPSAPNSQQSPLPSPQKETEPTNAVKESSTPLPTPAPGATAEPNGSVIEKAPSAKPKPTTSPAKQQGGSKNTGKPKPTAPVTSKPTGKPSSGSKEKQSNSATLSVKADTILANKDQFDEDKLELLPKDGVIYSKQKVIFEKGESVFDVLLREMKKKKIHLEFSKSSIYGSNYIEGINNIYEFDGGELSGWMYKVNGVFPNYGSSSYKLKDGDTIEWIYTLDLGRDVGAKQVAAPEGKR